MAVVLAGIVGAVVLAGAALGGDEGAVDQDNLLAPGGDLLQCPVQARGLRGEQTDHLVAPAPDGALGDVVAAGHVGQALVVPQHGQDDHRDLPRRQGPPARTYSLQMASQQAGEVADRARGQRQTALVDKGGGVPGVLFGILHTIPTSPGGTQVRPAPRTCGSWAGNEAAVG
jgi:hypothetical protein